MGEALELCAEAREREPPRVFTVDEMANVVSKLKDGKAAGTDGLTAEVLRATPPAVLEAMLECINDVTAGTKQTPRSWKEAVVALLPKDCRARHARADKFRPIALMSVPCKMWLGMVHQDFRE